MKNFLLILFLLCCFGAQAQEKDDFKRFGVGVNFSGMSCFRNVTLNQQFRNYEEANDFLRFSYLTGINLSCKPSTHFEIQLGYHFSSIIFQTKWDTQVVYIGNNKYDTCICSDVEKNSSFEFPLHAKYIFGTKKVHFVAGVGIVPSKLQRGIFSYKEILDNGEIFKGLGGYSPNWKPLTILTSLSFGGEYQLSPFFNLRIESYYYRSLPAYDPYFGLHYGSPLKIERIALNLSLIYSFN